MAQGESLCGAASAIRRPAGDRRAGFQKAALAAVEGLDEEGRLGGHNAGFRGPNTAFRGRPVHDRLRHPPKIQIESIRQPLELIARLILTNSKPNAHFASGVGMMRCPLWVGVNRDMAALKSDFRYTPENGL
jgi:hypothetical protein